MCYTRIQSHMVLLCGFQKSAGNSGQQNLQKRLLREALEEDASVFQYDEVYDDMQAKKADQEAATKQTTEKKVIHAVCCTC